MHFVAQLFLYMSVAGFALLIFGLFTPWLALWWEDVQTRRKVLRLYGTITIISASIYFVIDYIERI